MTDISMSQAAQLTGKTRATIHKAIQGGRLSAFQDDKKNWRINPAELERVYPLVRTGEGVDVSGDRQESSADTGKLQALETEIAMLRDMLARADRERDDWKAEADRWHQEAESQTRLLTDQRQQPEPRKTWWQKLTGG
jgi:hypothetical protein